MADYRRKLYQSRHQFILSKYKNHRDAEGGIFTSDKRRKLLGIKAKSSKQLHEDTADFWYDVRTTVKNGLADLQLIAEVAHPEQLKEMFNLIPFAEWEKDNSKTSIPLLLKAILSSQPWYELKRKKGELHPVYNKEDDTWLAELAYEIVRTCLQFFKDHNLITSKAHQRLAEEVDDMLNSEVARAGLVTRNIRNVRF